MEIWDPGRRTAKNLQWGGSIGVARGGEAIIPRPGNTHIQKSYLRFWSVFTADWVGFTVQISEAGNNIQKSYLRFWSVFTQIESVLQSKFRRSPEKKIFKVFFLANYKILTIQKILVLEPRTGHFSRTWGFEAQGLTFRGQGRPRGLHLCWVAL